MDPQSVDIAKLNTVSYENTLRRSILDDDYIQSWFSPTL